jgi:hypothetical protein
VKDAEKQGVSVQRSTWTARSPTASANKVIEIWSAITGGRGRDVRTNAAKRDKEGLINLIYVMADLAPAIENTIRQLSGMRD